MNFQNKHFYCRILFLKANLQEVLLKNWGIFF